LIVAEALVTEAIIGGIRMRRTTSCLLLAFSMSASGASAQTPVPAAGPAVAPDPKDVASADAIITALYDANTNLVDQKRDSNRFRSLFIADGRLIPTRRAGTGPAVLRTQTVEDYIKQAGSGPPRGGFSEREIARTSQRFGNIMQVFSTYETHRRANDPSPARGINSIQLFDDGTRWWVVTVFWDNERPGNPIPAVYLKTPEKSP
jgi:hypothetical protein